MGKEKRMCGGYKRKGKNRKGLKAVRMGRVVRNEEQEMGRS